MPKFVKVSLENNTARKIKYVCAKQTRPNNSVGRDQDEAETQFDRFSWKSFSQKFLRSHFLVLVLTFLK